MPLSPGDKIDRYRILAPLGAGGMGEVYRAHDTRLQRDVALKILHPAAPGSKDSESTVTGARMLREARAAAALEHPNVIAVYDVGEIVEPEALRGTAYIAMELIKGRSLRAMVLSSAPPSERLRWLGDMARALGAAHDAGLVHRDVKPENVMIRDDGVVKVLDFGIAKRSFPSAPVDPTSSTEAQVLPALTTRGLVVGTPYYMAPEQMRNEVLDGRADQFSWGVVAYELLAGKPPWQAQGDALQLVSEILSATPPAPSSLNPAIPPHIDAVVLRALAKSREQRFASMREVVTALGAGVPSHAPSAFAPTASWDPVSPEALTASGAVAPPSVVKRTRVRAWALAGAALCVLAIGGALYARAHDAGRAPAPVGSASADTKDATFPDFGSTMSKVPGAAEAYRKGMQSLRDADADGALSELDRALALDPSFAAAHLRRATWRIPRSRADREHVREAVRLRASLGPHDRILLDALAPLLEVPENLVEAQKRLTQAFARVPADADVALHLCRAHQSAGAYEEARTTCLRASALDPEGAAPILEIAQVQLRQGDVAGARASFDACLRASPLATSCIQPLWRLQTYEGRCDEALSSARRLVSIHPASADAYYDLAIALVGAGESMQSVRLALASRVEHTEPPSAQVTKLHDAAHVAILEGDFGAARTQLRAWDQAVAASGEELDHFAVTADRVQLAEEEGNHEEAAALISDYLERRPAWRVTAEGDFSFFFIGQLYVLGELPRDRFVAKRAAWLAAEKAPHADDNFPWIDAYARPAATAADAREALDALPAYLPLPDASNRPPEWEGPIGRTYRLAGREREALPYLSRAAKSCVLLDSPFEQIWAALDLGLALEKLGQPEAACEAYDGVLRRWRRSLSSVAARHAAERSRALGCER